MNQKQKVMKKLILSLVFVSGFSLAKAQDYNLDTSDAFGRALYEALLSAPRPEIYEGTGYLDHRSSMGALKNIFKDSGKSFSRIFGSLPSEFPGVAYEKEEEIQVKVGDYYKKAIEGHSYDSIVYYVNEDQFADSGRTVKVEREVLSCYSKFLGTTGRSST